jgi:hypothetical protein
MVAGLLGRLTGGRVPVCCDIVGALLFGLENDARAHIQQISYGGALICRRGDLGYIGRHFSVQIEIAGIVQHSSKQAHNGFRGRHENVGRMCVVSSGMPVGQRIDLYAGEKLLEPLEVRDGSRDISRL